MKIRDILSIKGSRVWTIRASETIQEALHSLVTHKIGALLVTDDHSENIIGILSERDIVHGSYGNSKNLREAHVYEWMTHDVVTCSPEDEVSAVMSVMTERRVRHVPIENDGHLLGLVSIGDVVKSTLEESQHQIQHLKEYVFGNFA